MNLTRKEPDSVFSCKQYVNNMFIAENLQNREKYKENSITKDANRYFGICSPSLFFYAHIYTNS